MKLHVDAGCCTSICTGRLACVAFWRAGRGIQEIRIPWHRLPLLWLSPGRYFSLSRFDGGWLYRIPRTLLTFKAFLWEESWPAVLRTRCRSDYLQVAWCCVYRGISVLTCPLCLLFILHFKPWGFLLPLNKPYKRHWAETRVCAWPVVTSFASDVRWTLISIVSRGG